MIGRRIVSARQPGALVLSRVSGVWPGGEKEGRKEGEVDGDERP